MKYPKSTKNTVNGAMQPKTPKNPKPQYNLVVEVKKSFGKIPFAITNLTLKNLYTKT